MGGGRRGLMRGVVVEILMVCDRGGQLMGMVLVVLVVLVGRAFVHRMSRVRAR